MKNKCRLTLIPFYFLIWVFIFGGYFLLNVEKKVFHYKIDSIMVKGGNFQELGDLGDFWGVLDECEPFFSDY